MLATSAQRVLVPYSSHIRPTGSRYILVLQFNSTLFIQVGSGWLNPTEDGVWPLAETLAVARLAFEELDPDPGEQVDDDRECISYHGG